MKQKFLKKLYIILAFFARIYLKKTNPFIIGITWSVGKTSCRMIVTQVLQTLSTWSTDIGQHITDDSIYTSPKNFNSEIWLVLSIFRIELYSPNIFGILKATLNIILKSIFSKPKYKTIILEYGIDHPNDMDFLLTIAKPDITIFTKLDKVHSEYFGSIEAIWNEKFKLVYAAKKQVYLNFQDSFCIENASKVQVPVKYIFWWNIEIKDIKIDREDSGIFSSFVYDGEIIRTNIFWEENLNYIALGIDIANTFFTVIPAKAENYKNGNDNLIDSGSSSEWQFSKFFNLQLQPWRFSLFSWINHSILVDSTYNASPESMKKMILNTFSLRDKAFPNFKIWFVIWDMRELWDLSKTSHIEIAPYLEKADFVYTVWKETWAYLIPELSWKIENLKSFVSSVQAWKELKEFISEQTEEYIILFKWSQNTIFTEEALKQLLSHKIDEKKLVRQNKDWMKNKLSFAI